MMSSNPFKVFDSLGTGLQLPVALHRVPAVRALLILILLLALIGVFRAWPYSRTSGYYLAGGGGLLLAVLLVLFMFSYV
jgi:hypothetical protein